MTLNEIRENSIEELPTYKDFINNLMDVGKYQELFNFLRTSHKSEETYEIRRALLRYL